jgi:hypothetical protein
MNYNATIYEIMNIPEDTSIQGTLLFLHGSY